MQPIWLYGPPGAGKSTLISALAATGERAIDIESTGATQEERRAAVAPALSAVRGPGRVWIGAADLSLADAKAASAASGVSEPITILLLPERAAYAARRSQRDRAKPHKAGQRGDSVYDGFARAAGQFNVTLDTALQSVPGTVRQLLAVGDQLSRSSTTGGKTPTMDNRQKKAPVRTPLAAPVAALVAAVWVAEEMGEMADAAAKGDVMGTTDAILDAMGILLELLALPEIARAVGPGYKEYVDSQVRRGRSMRNAHQVVMAKILHDWPLIARDKLTPEEVASAAREIFAGRADRGLPEQLRESGRLLRDTASRLKAAARSKETASDELDLALMTKAARDRENPVAAAPDAPGPVGLDATVGSEQ